MESILYTEINAIGFMILLIVHVSRGRSGGIQSPDQKLFNIMVLLTMGILVFDTGMWLCDGGYFRGAVTLNFISTLLYYIDQPLIPFFWFMYCRYRSDPIKFRLRGRMVLSCLPLAAALVMTFISIGDGSVFSIDNANVYSRGPLFLIYGALSVSYLFAAVFITLRNAVKTHDHIERHEQILLSLYLLPPIAGVGLQTAVYGLSLIWILSAISSLLVFISLQNRLISTDALTGSNNRRQMNKHLHYRVNTPVPEETLYLIMIDIDAFKKLNDTYGHAVGDAMLVEASDILKGVCHGKNDFLARMGGDEFTIICLRRTEDELLKTIEQIERAVDEANSRRGTPYTLSFSVGYAAFGQDGAATADELISAADTSMYKVKTAKKAAAQE